MVARVESLRGRISAFEPRSPRGIPPQVGGAGGEMFFQVLLAQSFREGLSQSFGE
jgi:hypothetical protein